MAYAGEGSSRLKFSKKKLKGEFFIKNGARLLEDSVTSFKGGAQPIRMFSEKELQKATNNYDQILGKEDMSYTMYKGMHENRTIMVKKYEGDERAKNFAFNEAVVLSHVNHRNVVKLIGCCIETQAPIIVCEYLSNGNLKDHIKEVDPSSRMSWEIRLKIATEIAYALAYLHIANSRPIVVRDLKSDTIFLDESYTVKIIDFGKSVLIPLGETFVETDSLEGTFGRIDLHYMNTGKLSDKTDVYSFGILLIELLTGTIRIFKSTDSPLPVAEITRMMNAWMREKGNEDQLRACVELAVRCTRQEGEERPTMKQVTEELRRIKKFSIVFKGQSSGPTG